MFICVLVHSARRLRAMAIDDLLGDLHQDRVTVTRSLKGKIDEEIAARRAASFLVISTLEEQIRDLTEQINRQQSGGGMVDLHRKDREHLERERRDRELLLAMERVNLWRDQQHAKAEERLLTREELEEQQRYERFNKAFY